MGDYHKALQKEMLLYAAYATHKPLQTIFLGGGTPSTYPPELLLDTFGILNTTFTIARDAEITIEVNPGTVTPEKIQAWKAAGINRLSIGVQSLNNTVLASLNRHQKAAQVLEVLEQTAQEFAVLSVDLILGLPGITSDEWQELIEQVVTWPIKHISVYFLTVHEDTPLYYGVRKKRIMLPADDVMIAQYYWTIEKLNAYGFEQYEISNFAKKGYQSRHNARYWKRMPYKGFGLGACSFDGASRFQNEKNLMRYMELVTKATTMHDLEPLNVMSETLTSEQAWLEVLMLGIRQKEGLPWSTVAEYLAPATYTHFVDKVAEFKKLGHIDENEVSFWLTLRGKAMENEIAVQLSSL